jgi:putative ABC transport system substrate-binding protein
MKFVRFTTSGTLTLALLAAPAPAKAQQPAGKVFRIGFLGAASLSTHGRLIEAFRQGLRDQGYVEGQNLAIEYRWAEGKYERLLCRRRPESAGFLGAV